MAQYSVGASSYGDLSGITQYVNSPRIAAQFKSLAYDYAKKFGANGDRLTVNEGMRSRPRQSLLYTEYLKTGYPKAAVPFTSRHDAVLHGNAIDVGVTQANGTNRALTSAEFDWMHEQAEQRGFTWTGRYFNEPWHIEGATRAEIKAPYSDDVLNNAPKPSKPVTPADDEKIEDDMRITWVDNQPTLWVGTGSWDMTNLRVSGKVYQLPEVLGYVRRLIRADQTKDYPEKFNKQENAILREVLKKVK